MEGRLKVLATGTVVVDVLAVELEKIAKPGEVVYLDRKVEVRSGGHPHNIAIDLVKLGIESREVGLVAALGKGFWGDYVKKIIANYKIKAFFQEFEEIDTGVDVILVKKKEDRRFHIYSGANWYLNPDFVKAILYQTKPQIFSLRPGYCGIDLALQKLVKEAKKAGSFVLLDIMKLHPKRPQDLLLPVFKYADAIHCNEKEAMSATGKKDSEEALKDLLNREAPIIFLTKGEQGAEVITDQFRISQPAFQIQTIDPTGSGDAFCAGIIYKLLQWNIFKDIHKLDQSLLCELLITAQAVGASAATAAGCTEGVSKEKVDQILQEQKEEILRKTIIRPGL